MLKIRLILILMMVSGSLFSLTPQTKQAINDHIPNAQLVGSAQYSYLFWDVYKGFLFAPYGQYRQNKRFALTLAYQRALSGSAITQKTIELIRKQNPGVSEKKLKQWEYELNNIFPDVDAGTELTGVHTKDGTALFYNQSGQSIGAIKDPKFSNHFFDIWLGPDTTDPDFRDQLLGKN